MPPDPTKYEVSFSYLFEPRQEIWTDTLEEAEQRAAALRKRGYDAFIFPPRAAQK